MSILCVQFYFTIAQNITEVFVCLKISVPPNFSYEDVTITGEELQILTYALSSTEENNQLYFEAVICLFVWGFSCDLRIFHLYGHVTITSEELKILTYDWNSWPLSTSLIYIFNVYLFKKTAVFHFLRHLITKAQKRD